MRSEDGAKHGPSGGAGSPRSTGSKGTAIRFIAGGLLNTAATYLLYLALVQFISYQLAYLISFCAGILISYMLNTKYVFRSAHTWQKFAAFPLIYLLVYAVGALVLRIAVRSMGVPEQLGPILSVAATLPLSFFLTRLLLLPPNPAANSTPASPNRAPHSGKR